MISFLNAEGSTTYSYAINVWSADNYATWPENDNFDRAWFEELDRRMAQGIGTAKQKHSRPPKQAMIAKKRPIKYSREPRLSANWLRRQEKC